MKLPKVAQKFLFNAGLPNSAAPGLKFVSHGKGGLSKITELFREYPVGEELIYMGITGEGDLVCVLEGSGMVISLDHEDGKRIQFINSSIPQLAECLLVYSEFGKQVRIANGQMAFVKRNAPSELLDTLINDFQSIDKDVFNGDSFWTEELSWFTDK